jgi:SAM-dependent methyltransferase
MTLDAALREAAAGVVRRLAQQAGLMAFCGPIGTAPFRDPQELRRLLAGTSTQDAAMIRLLLGGDRLTAGEACAALGDDAVALLLRAGVLHADENDGVCSTHLLVSCLNRHVLATPPPGHPRFDPAGVPYCGPESLWFAQFLALRGPCRRSLDLCTGSGILAMLPEAAEITAVDIDTAALDVAAFSLALNRRGNIVLVQGDLFAPVGEEKFDLVTANPPFLPGGPGPRLPACGDGGRRGDAVLARILAEAADHLAPGGEALIYAEGFGDRAGPAILADLPDTRLSPAHDYTFWIGGTRNAQQAIFDLCRLWQSVGATEAEAWAHWQDIAATIPVSHYHHGIWRIAEGRGGVAVRRLRPG